MRQGPAAFAFSCRGHYNLQRCAAYQRAVDGSSSHLEHACMGIAVATLTHILQALRDVGVERTIQLFERLMCRSSAGYIYIYICSSLIRRKRPPNGGTRSNEYDRIGTTMDILQKRGEHHGIVPDTQAVELIAVQRNREANIDNLDCIPKIYKTVLAAKELPIRPGHPGQGNI